MGVLNSQAYKDYCLERATQERRQVVQCSDQTAALAHLKLAAEYERRAHRLGGIK
jgi:hypothetical protein